MSDELQGELAEQIALADAGEAAAVFLHELGNVLNNILLQARLMQHEAPPALQQRLAETCKHISQTALHMKYLAQFRQGRRIRPYPLDVNDVVRSLVPAHAQADLTSDATSIMCTVADLKRTILLLLRNAGADKSQTISVATRREGDQVSLRIDCAGLTATDDELAHLFDPFRGSGLKPDGLELAICKELVRRARGQIIADRNDRGNLVYIATWPGAL
jgi:signal transduction histidine kinase